MRPPCAAPPPPRLGLGWGPLLVEDLLDVALGDLQALAGQLRRELTDGQVLELFGAEPVQVFLDALALGHGAVATRLSWQAGLPVV